MRGQTLFSYALVVFGVTALTAPAAVDQIEERQIPGLEFAAKILAVEKERALLERRQAKAPAAGAVAKATPTKPAKGGGKKPKATKPPGAAAASGIKPRATAVDLQVRAQAARGSKPTTTKAPRAAAASGKKPKTTATATPTPAPDAGGGTGDKVQVEPEEED